MFMDNLVALYSREDVKLLFHCGSLLLIYDEIHIPLLNLQAL